eukprot:Skav223263  [mRNA]  locus=scaffold1037:222397:235492:- [translate_table: standard]
MDPTAKALPHKADDGGMGWFATILLLVECVVAMVSEMSGVAATGRLWGMDYGASVVLAALVVICVAASTVLGLTYRQIEAIGIALGAFEAWPCHALPAELTFVVTMVYYHPSLKEMLGDTLSRFSDPEYMKLISANIGAVIMPWMIYFQQSAVVARRLQNPEQMAEERTGTLLGSILTQMIMIGALVTLAASHTINKDRRPRPWCCTERRRELHRPPPSRTSSATDLHSMEDIIEAIGPAFGQLWAKILVSLAFIGGSLCAAFVVSLAATWALCEAAKSDDVVTALDQSPRDAPRRRFMGSLGGAVGWHPDACGRRLSLSAVHQFGAARARASAAAAVRGRWEKCCTVTLAVDHGPRVRGTPAQLVASQVLVATISLSTALGGFIRDATMGDHVPKRTRV